MECTNNTNALSTKMNYSHYYSYSNRLRYKSHCNFVSKIFKFLLFKQTELQGHYKHIMVPSSLEHSEISLHYFISQLHNDASLFLLLLEEKQDIFRSYRRSPDRIRIAGFPFHFAVIEIPNVKTELAIFIIFRHLSVVSLCLPKVNQPGGTWRSFVKDKWRQQNSDQGASPYSGGGAETWCLDDQNGIS